MDKLREDEGGRISVLLVEDDGDSREALKNLLVKRDVIVTTARSAEEVVGGMCLDGFDALVADIRLDGMSGIDLLRHVRKELPDFPVILITGYDSLDSAVQAVRLGAQDYILKPFDSIDDLLIPVRKAVENHRLLRRNVELESDLKRRCLELRELDVRLSESREAERRRLCRELHDHIGGTLTSLGMNVNFARETLAQGRQEQSQERLEQAQVEVEEIAGALRRVMSELYPSVLGDYGLPAALRWYGREFAGRTSADVMVEVDELPARLPAAVETTLFRIAQEALTNILKHASAENVSLTLTGSGATVMLEIEDDGDGFDAAAPRAPGGGVGLLFMRERAESIGGRLEVMSAAGEGTRIVVSAGRGLDADQDDTGR